MHRTLRRAAGALVGLVGTFIVPALAFAEDPMCNAGGSLVVLHGDGVPPALFAPFVRQLRAALTRRSIGLCVLEAPDADPPRTRPLAGLGLTIESKGTDDIVVTVNVRDEVTSKSVMRDVSLQGLPEDARALVLAEAADELLRASWAELLVDDAPAAKQEPPPEVRRAIEPRSDTSTRSWRAPVVEVAAGIGGEVFGTGQRQVGVDLSAVIFPVARVGALLDVGMRAVSRAEAQHGLVEASALVGALGVVLAPFAPSPRYGLDVGPEIFATQTTYRGVARSSAALGSNDTGTSAHISAVGRAWIAIAGPLRASASVLVGAPLRPVRVVAEHESVTGTGGILGGAELALGAAW